MQQLPAEAYSGDPEHAQAAATGVASVGAVGTVAPESEPEIVIERPNEEDPEHGEALAYLKGMTTMTIPMQMSHQQLKELWSANNATNERIQRAYPEIYNQLVAAFKARVAAIPVDQPPLDQQPAQG